MGDDGGGVVAGHESVGSGCNRSFPPSQCLCKGKRVQRSGPCYFGTSGAGFSFGSPSGAASGRGGPPPLLPAFRSVGMGIRAEGIVASFRLRWHPSGTDKTNNAMRNRLTSCCIVCDPEDAKEWIRKLAVVTGVTAPRPVSRLSIAWLLEQGRTESRLVCHRHSQPGPRTAERRGQRDERRKT